MINVFGWESFFHIVVHLHFIKALLALFVPKKKKKKKKIAFLLSRKLIDASVARAIYCHFGLTIYIGHHTYGRVHPTQTVDYQGCLGTSSFYLHLQNVENNILLLTISCVNRVIKQV